MSNNQSNNIHHRVVIQKVAYYYMGGPFLIYEVHSGMGAMPGKANYKPGGTLIQHLSLAEDVITRLNPAIIDLGEGVQRSELPDSLLSYPTTDQVEDRYPEVTGDYEPGYTGDGFTNEYEDGFPTDAHPEDVEYDKLRTTYPNLPQDRGDD